MTAPSPRPATSPFRRALAAALTAAALLAIPPSLARAQPSAGRRLLVPATAQQHALAVRVAPPFIQIQACQRGRRCSADGGSQVTIPEDALAQAADARLEAISLGHGRRVVQVSVPGARLTERWVLLIAPSQAQEPPEVLRPLTGWLGRPRGQPGERRTDVLLREPTSRGAERLVLGSRYEHVSLCGRPATIRTRQLHPEALEWRWTNARTLSAAMRQQAIPLTAASSPEPWSQTRPRLLHATSASSAVGRDVAALSDGDLSTAWSENRPGEGAGEFVLLSSSKAVPIVGFEIVPRPTGRPRQQALAPRRLHLATDTQLFEVTLPDDPWSAPSADSFRITLPEPIHTSCVAVVLADAHPAPAADQVTLAELRAITEWDGTGSWSELVVRLQGEPQLAEAAAAMLRRGGEPALRATLDGYAALDEAGQRRALAVLDAGSCADLAGVFVEQLGAIDGAGQPPSILTTVTRNRLRECGADAARALQRALQDGPPSAAQARAARELALYAPEQTIRSIAAVLHRAGDDVRRTLRAALSGAAKRRRARAAVEQQLAPATFTARPLVTRIDLLRSFGPRLATVDGAAAALQNVLDADRSFRTRYLVQMPAAQIAQGGDPAALAFVRQSLLRDESPHVRAQAARAGAGLAGAGASLEQALHDEAPRVRQATLESLSDASTALSARGQRQVATLLRRDPWTFVRAAASSALGARAPEPATDEALLAGLEQDESSIVRAAILAALGQRKSASTLPAVRDKADEPRESIAVRKAALRALGAMCDAESMGLLTKLAQRAAAAQVPYDRPLGEVALKALGQIHPPDLAERLAPLLDPRAPVNLRRMARALLRHPGSCAEGSASPTR